MNSGKAGMYIETVNKPVMVKPINVRFKVSGRFNNYDGPQRKKKIPAKMHDSINVTLLSIHPGKQGVKNVPAMLING